MFSRVCIGDVYFSEQSGILLIGRKKKGRPKQGYTEVKKKLSTVAALLAALLLLLSAAVGALPKLSPALDVLSAQHEMTVSAVHGSCAVFDESLFESALGGTPYQIKISALPDESDGVLLVGNSTAFVGQTVSRSNLSLLRFEGAASCTDTSLEFISDGVCATVCHIRFTDGENSAPVCLEYTQCVTTQEDIAACGTLRGTDRDGDSFFFEVTSYPSHGILELSADGSYRYTPYAGVTGSDSFSYRACDEYGNYSDAATLEVNIEKRASDAELCDMEGHPAHSAALSAVADGSMDVICEAGKLYFDPDDVMTREEFLRTVMLSLGAPKLEPCTTPFADGDEISENCSGFAAAAYRLGIIKGEREGGLAYFRAQDAITRAEGAAILNRILGVSTDTAAEVFSDIDSAPAWALADIRALGSIGIIDGAAAAPNAVLTRAQTAQLLYSAKLLYR